MTEVARCADEYGFPGMAIMSEVQGLGLDDPAFEPYWTECERRGLYVFIHPLNPTIAWNRMDTDDLHRAVGREFSLIAACIKLICSGVLDRHPDLRVLFAHLAGGVGWYVGRFLSYLEDKEFWGTEGHPVHGRKPEHGFLHYLENRLMFDTGGWSGPIDTARYAVQWVERGLMDIPASQLVFATDYPQAVRGDAEIVDYVAGIRALGADGERILGTENAAKLIPDLTD
jgi:predicted TIM-barrel fold metal-dependent hydrolase